jgi:hypothetical protein
MKVKPVDPSAVIRDPHTKVPLPAEGGEVPDTNFWNRRLLDGSVVRIKSEPTGTEPVASLTTRGSK